MTSSPFVPPGRLLPPPPHVLLSAGVSASLFSFLPRRWVEIRRQRRLFFPPGAFSPFPPDSSDGRLQERFFFWPLDEHGLSLLPRRRYW